MSVQGIQSELPRMKRMNMAEGLKRRWYLLFRENVLKQMCRSNIKYTA